jgi:short-subunit dehydrogenase
MELAGARVLVTGASRGIGEEIAREVARRGAAVALVARSGDRLRSLAAELGGTAHPADLGDPEQVRDLVGRVEEEAGPVDVLVNNAGIDLAGWLPDAPSEELRAIYQLNLVTPAELCRQVIPRMLGRGRGHLVNISSMAGVGVFPGLVAYSSTKAGLTHFTAGLRADLRGLPIGTTVVELGPIPTDMLDHVESYPPTQRSFRRGYRLGLVADVPKQRVAAAVADAVARGRRHVRLPRRMAPFAVTTELPRRITELILTGVRPR